MSQKKPFRSIKIMPPCHAYGSHMPAAQRRNNLVHNIEAVIQRSRQQSAKEKAKELNAFNHHLHPADPRINTQQETQPYTTHVHTIIAAKSTTVAQHRHAHSPRNTSSLCNQHSPRRPTQTANTHGWHSAPQRPAAPLNIAGHVIQISQ